MVAPVNRQNKLRYLAALTAVVLAGIIALQFYWLYTSYKQQSNRFRADVTSIVSEVAMYESMVNVYNSAGSNAPGSSSKVVINFIASSSKQRQGRPFSVKISDDQPTTAPAVFISTPDDKPGVQITPHMLDSLLDSCRVMLDSELKHRDIHAPFELALIDNKGTIVKATCDTTSFRKIASPSPIKPLIADGVHARLSMQVAFPDANLYLLRRMAMILAVTILLIIIGAWSFSYMLIHFFRQKKISDIRNDFMNNMTHELKTPISAALVAVEMVEGKRHPLNEAEKMEYLGVAKGELNRLTMLIDKVLKMAAFDQREITMNKSEVPVSDMLNEARENLRGILETAGADARIQVTSPALSIHGDRVHLVNVFQNLIENAVKYNDKSSPVITIDATGAEAGVTITVTDNGRGIPQEYVTKVFDKFFRVPTGDVHDIKGYGLGLSYIKAIVALHGGTVSVTSEEKIGSTFTVFLPNKS